MLDEEKKNDLLKNIRGSKRTETGVLITGDGFEFHITGMGQYASELSDQEKFFASFCSTKEIIRLRSIKSPHDYLLRLRAEAIVDEPRLGRVFDKRKNNFSGSWSLTHYYHSLNEAPRRYINRLPKNFRCNIKKHPYGFVPQVEANACCYNTLVGQIVTVSESLRYFYYYLSIFIYGGDFSIEAEDRMAAAYIAVRIMTGAETADFDIDSRGTLPRIVEAKIRGHVGEMIEFTFGHEFGHLLLGHTEVHKNTKIINSTKRLKIFNHEKEYEADLHAVNAVQQKPGKLSMYSAGCNVFLYLHFLGLLSQKHSEILDFSVSSTHPNPIERLDNLRNSYKYTEIDFNRSIDVITSLAETFSSNVKQSTNEEILSFYGSVYMQGLGGEIRRDRIDF